MYNVLIRPLCLEDAKISFQWRNDPEIWHFTGKRPDKLITEEIEAEWLSEKLTETNAFRFAIDVDNQYIGNIQITDIMDRENGQFHIFIGEKSFWGKGIARLAIAQIIRFAKEKLNLKELYLVVNPRHKAAISLYQKCGFYQLNNEIRMRLMLRDSILPFLSVFVMSYNQEKFIALSLQGILMQKTNFDFDIVIGADCSSDHTRQIILKYADKYSGKFKLLVHERNIGPLAHQIAGCNACKGKYLALCLGDELLTDPNILQKQVDSLELNEVCGSLHTNCNISTADENDMKEMTIFRNTTNMLIPTSQIHKALTMYNSIAS